MENIEDIRIGDRVLYPTVDNSSFRVIGIRPRQVELEGDFSGGTCGFNQTDWVDVANIKPVPWQLGDSKGIIKIFKQQLWDARVCEEYVLTQGYSRDETVFNLVRRLSFSRTAIVSAFPGTGKSHCYRTANLSILDSDSSKFDKSDFPANYIRHIKENIGRVDVIFVSSHKVVRDALTANGIEFILAHPGISLKSEYLARYRQRQSPESFISLIDANWDAWIKEMEEQQGCFRQQLKSEQYLSDFISA